MKLFDDEAVNRRFHALQWRMLMATMVGYTLFYFMRKNFSFAMPGLEQDCGISKSMLGNFLFAGGIVYGISKFVNGFIGDRCNSRRMLCFGLLACTLVNVAFGFAPQIAAWLGNGERGMGNEGQTLAWTFGILLVLNQFFQGTGFPPCARLIAFWIPPNELAALQNSVAPGRVYPGIGIAAWTYPGGDAAKLAEMQDAVRVAGCAGSTIYVLDDDRAEFIEKWW